MLETLVTHIYEGGLPGAVVQNIGDICWRLYEGPADRQVEVVFLGEEEHCNLHERFLQDASPTDVIAFPYETKEESSGNGDKLFGEIAVNVEMAKRQARQRNLDIAQELSLYVAHGFLHLLGFDDGNPAECKEMRSAEQAVLQELGFSLP